MRFAILGPLEVFGTDGPLTIGGPQQRALLTALLVRANESVSSEQLAIALWGDEVPRARVNAVYVNVSRLRKALQDDGHVIETTCAGYRLRVGPEELDTSVFARLAEAAVAAGPERSLELAGAALALWRGEPLVDSLTAAFARVEIAKLRELRLQMLEMRAEASIALGRHVDAVPSLQELAGQHPERETVTRLLMVALYSIGRHADALAAYRRTREHLSRELGLEPSPRLRELEQAVLTHQLTTRAHRSSLPSPAGSLVGREDERHSLIDLLTRRGARLVTLIGAGGVGKTRLALEVARGMPPPVAWIELGGVGRAEDVAATIVMALGGRPKPGETAELALLRICEARTLLLVVDNLEHVIAAAPLLGRLVAHSPGMSVLATSRQPLELTGEQCRPIGPLEPDAAGALFAEAARRRDPSFAPTPAVTRICERLDRLPLAIELAAARMPLFSPDELAARLDDAFPSLGEAPRDAPDRHRTLRASIEWSHRLLDEDERAALAAFSVFAGGAELDAAEAVTGASTRTLQALVDRSLLHRAGGRLAMLETVRAFARERLTTPVRRRHLHHFTQLAARADAQIFTAEESQALRRLDRAIDNLRAALAWGIEHEPVVALTLAIALGKYFNVRGDPQGPDWIEAAIAAAADRAPLRDRAQAHLRLSFILDGRHRDGTAAARTALELAIEASDHSSQSTAHFALAGELFDTDPDAARRHAHQALRHAQASQDDALLTDAHRVLAWVLPPDEREPHMEAAIAGLRRSGGRRHECTLHANLASVAIAEGRYDDAIRLARTAVALQTEDLGVAARARANLGFAHLFAGRTDEAADMFIRQLQIAREHAAPALASHGLSGLAAVAASHGDHTRCAVLLGAARQLDPDADAAFHAELGDHYYGDARSALGAARWQDHLQTGARLTFTEAIETGTGLGSLDSEVAARREVRTG